MNQFKLLKKSVLVLSVFAFLFTSCKKDDSVNPDYVGTWSATVAGLMKTNLTLTTAGYEQTMQMYDETSKKWIDFTKFTGSMTVNDSTLNVTVTGFGVAEPNAAGTATTIVMYKKGSAEFDANFADSGFDAVTSYKYKVSGNSLTITDSGETTVYTKQ